MNLEAPKELAELKQWVAWERVIRKGKTTKVPHRVDGRRASTTRRSDWSTLPAVLEAVRQGGGDGVGFVFSSEDEYVGVDLDNCMMDDGAIHPEAQAVVEAIGSYTELSPSGTGLHVIFRSKDEVRGTRTTGAWGGSLEVYGSGRYFTFTGESLPGHDHVIESTYKLEGESVEETGRTGQVGRQALDKALKRDTVLRRLFYDGYESDEWASASDADMSFVSRLVKAIGPDPLAIRGVLKESALWRPKWETSDYFARTLGRAMDLKPADELEVQRYNFLRATDAAKVRIREEDATADGFQLPTVEWTFADDLALPEVEDEYRVESLLPVNVNLLLVAMFKAGKSTLMRNMVKSLLDGTDFLGRFPVQKVEGTVCYINGEETPSHWRDSMSHHNIGDPTRLRVLHRRGIGPVPLWDPTHFEAFAEFLRAGETEVLIIDTAVSAWRKYVDNENDNMQVANFASLLDDLKAASGVKELVLVHHTGRVGGTGRGASSLEGWMDVGLYLDVDDKNTRSIRAIGRSVELDKTDLVYDRDTGSLKIGSVAKHKAETTEKGRGAKKAILDLLSKHPDGLSQSQVCTELKGQASRSFVLGALEGLADSPGSSVRRIKGERNSSVYSIDPNANKPGR